MGTNNLPLSTTRPASLHIGQPLGHKASPCVAPTLPEAGQQDTVDGGRVGSGRRKTRHHQRNKSHGGVVAYVSSATSPRHALPPDRRVCILFVFFRDWELFVLELCLGKFFCLQSHLTAKIFFYLSLRFLNYL